MTPQELLDQVETAITTILTGGQSYAIDTGSGNRTFTRANLQTLRDWRDSLRAEVDRDAKGGIGIQYGVPNR